MREILFRGKRIDNGEWVYGHYTKVTPQNDSDGHRICSPDTWNMYPVLPETVGQYTGLKDKNGKEIYEGDILHKDSHWGWYVEYEDGAFCRMPINIVQRINWEHYRMKQKNVEDWEIIGNIHENKELLEVNE